MPTQSRFVPVGSEAPDFTLPSVSGEQVQLSDYRGQKHKAGVVRYTYLGTQQWEIPPNGEVLK